MRARCPSRGALRMTSSCACAAAQAAAWLFWRPRCFPMSGVQLHPGAVCMSRAERTCAARVSCCLICGQRHRHAQTLSRFCRSMPVAAHVMSWRAERPARGQEGLWRQPRAPGGALGACARGGAALAPHALLTCAAPRAVQHPPLTLIPVALCMRVCARVQRSAEEGSCLRRACCGASGRAGFAGFAKHELRMCGVENDELVAL